MYSSYSLENTTVCPSGASVKLGGLDGPSLTTCLGQYDIGVTTVAEEPRKGEMMPSWSHVLHASSMIPADKEAFEGQHAASDLEAGSNHDHHLNALPLSRSGVPSFHPVASTHADFPDATSQHQPQPTYTPPSDASVLRHPCHLLSASLTTTRPAEMNYPATNYPYHVGGEVDGYAPSCDFLYPFVDLKPTATAFQHSWAPSHSGATYNVASFGEERPPTGSSSMSTPQLTASSGRGASCSPLSTYDETPSPRVDSIDYATVSGGTEVYTAPATIFDWECANAHGTQYGNPALNGAASLGHPTHPEYNPEYWSFQGAALQNCSSSSAPTWPQEPYNMPMQGFGQPLTEAESQSYWAAACGQAHPSAEPLQHIAEPSSFASSFGAHASQPTTATGAAELHHPRPQRGWLLAWQTAVDFDADEFLASLSRKSTSPANPPQPTCENDSFAMDEDVGSETEEDELSYPDCDDSEEMEADWQIEGNASPGSIERPDLFFDSNGWSGASSAASAEVDIGQGIGLGFSTRTLGPDSILCQPVFFSGQPDPSWMQPEDAAEHHQLSTLSPSFP